MYGKEYVIHDIDENNTIVGKAFLDGFAKLEEGQVVDGFIEEIPLTEVFNRKGSIPTEFQPPKFGLTVFGNSHGFDAGGSTSGYVLWVNGRGIMIDPPPYSSATLMKEGINPALIIGIILTHCHADHDAGAFVTVLAGSPVVIITTPTIYKSFITKYSALSKLSSGLIEKSHRNIYAIIGQPLHFHGAIFYFCYSLHSIPCICFRVELGGRSMVFTGDTLYNPPLLKKLEKDGILSKTRAKLLCDWSTQPCDYIFHEAGVPPIHTPISILKELDDEIKQRMYIVHTASVPEGCGLRCAPTGTAETLRLEPNTPHENFFETASSNFWFQLSLFSAIPFVTDLTYSATMDLLEVVRVKFFEKGAIVVPQARRKDVLCVIWEGTCHERPVVSSTNEDFNNDGDYEFNCLGSLNCRKRPVGSNEIDDSDSDDDIIFWSAGDWSGPVSLQPEKILCGESKRTRTHDIVAWSSFGVKAIFVEKTDLKRILQHSPLYKRFLSLSKPNENDSWGFGDLDKNQAAIHRAAIRDFNLSNLLALNSTLKKLKPVQKTHFQCLEGKLRYISPEECIGSSMENAFLLVSGTAELRENVPAPGSVAANARLVQENLKNEECSRIVGKQKCGFGAKLNGFHKLTQRLHHRAERMTKKKTPNSNNFTLRNIETLSNDLYGRRISRRKSVIDRNNNVLLSRMFLKNSITDGLIFSKGNFICNVLDMHSSVYSSEERLSDSNMLDSNMLGTFEAPQFVAGVDGCVVFEIPKESFIGFLGSYPGLFFSLLGTQAVI
uniref:Metallo-beta-lactamase domain-containing protein n=1 Tax=Corethron hystrix TaxID=216773 RepID=A0A7S1BBZ3_9STRA